MNPLPASSLPISPYDSKLGLQVDRVSPELATGSAPVEDNTQPGGLWHGGASATLIETLGSLAASQHAGSRQAVGTELNVSHLRAVRAGRVHGTATALHLGRTSAVYQVALTDDTGRLIATGRVSCRILD